MRFNNQTMTLKFIDYCKSWRIHGTCRREGVWWKVDALVAPQVRKRFIEKWADMTMEVRDR